MKEHEQHKVTEVFSITWLWAMEQSVCHTGNEISQGDNSETQPEDVKYTLSGPGVLITVQIGNQT